MVENDRNDQTALTNQSATFGIQDKATGRDHTTLKLSDSSDNTNVVSFIYYNFREMFLISFNVLMTLISLLALVSSGANTQFISCQAIQKLHFKQLIKCCQRLIRLLNAFNKDCRVEESITLPLKVKDWVGAVPFYVLDNCPAEVIAGAPFINKYNSEFNWE